MLAGGDMINAGIFFRSLMVDYVKEHGSVPQWNPYIFGGMPFVDAFHGDIFYPFSFLKYFGSIYRMLGMNLFWHIFLAGIFMYLTARQFRLSKIAALLSAICYMFAAFLISLVAAGHDGKVFVVTFFPLVILFLDRGFNSEKFFSALLNFSLMGLVIGVIILSPHAQMSYFTLWAAALYTIFKMVTGYLDSKSIKRIFRPAVLSVYAVVIGLLLSAIQFYPGYYYTTHDSPRVDSKQGWDWATSWSMHQEEAFSLLIPEFAGTKSETEKTYYWGKNAFKDNSESVGVVAIFVALIGFFFTRRREAYFFGGLALFALIYALGATTPFFKLFFYLIPKVKSLRAPSMIMFLFSFSAALLAGMGLQKIMENATKARDALSKRFDALLFGFPGFMLLLSLLFGVAGKGMLRLWTSLFYSDAATTMVQANFSKLDVAYANLPAIQSGAWWAFLMTACIAVGIWLYRSGKLGSGVLVALLLVPVVDGVRFNQRFVTVVDPAQYWSPNVVSEYFKRVEGDFRVMNFTTQIIPPDYLPYFKTDVVVGYHGNQLRWYDELLGGPGKLNQTNPNFLNLVGARYILFPATEEFPDGYFGDRPVIVAQDFGPVRILKNDNALPRVFLANQYRVFDDYKMIFQRVLGGFDDLRHTVYLEETPALTLTADTAVSTDSAWITDYQMDSVVVGVGCTENRLLVLTDNYYDSWHAYVDGQPARLLRAYGSFRAVEIPAGSKQVIFKYYSERYHTGRLVTWLTSLYLLLIIGFCLFVNRSASKEERIA